MKDQLIIHVFLIANQCPSVMFQNTEVSQKHFFSAADMLEYGQVEEFVAPLKVNPFKPFMQLKSTILQQRNE